MKRTKRLFCVLAFVFGIYFARLVFGGALGGTHKGEFIQTNAEPMYLCSTNPSIWQPLPVWAGHAIGTNVATMTLKWIVETNWVQESQADRTVMLPESANTTTFHESGTIRSNLYAFVEWKGDVKGVMIESVEITRLSRSFTVQPTRLYSPIKVTPIRPWYGSTFITNGSMTNWLVK